MGRKPKPSQHPSSLHEVTVRLSGEQKNALIERAQSEGLSLNAYISWVLWDYCQREKGLDPAPAPVARPSHSDVIRSYLSGERLLMPCGKQSCEMKVVSFGDAEYCDTCSLRIL